MPHRFVSVAILLFWIVAASALVRKDVLPNWIVGPPPDLRTVSQAEGNSATVKWGLLAKDGTTEESYRPIGKVVARSVRRRDGTIQWTSEAWFDAAEFAGRLAKGMRRPEADDSAPAGADLIHVNSLVEIDPVGNLFHLRASLRADGETEDLLVLEGQVRQNELVVTTVSPLPMLRGTRSLPYEPRGLVENPLSPIDRMPGLKVGQRWESQMINPLTGKAQGVRSEVVGLERMHWGSNLVTAHVVLTRAAPLSFRTWVRSSDGLVIRQEVPYPLASLLLERQPDEAASRTVDRP